jgi:hypothetical protein
MPTGRAAAGGEETSVTNALKTVRNISIVGLAIVFLVGAGGLIMYRSELAGGVHLNTAHTRLIETLAREEPGSVLELVNTTPRSCGLLIGVTSAVESDEERARLEDAVWIAYVEAFGAEGFAVSHVGVAMRGAEAPIWSERLGAVDVVTLVERTGRSAPALHAMYANNDYFDVAVEAPPTLDDDSQ